MSETTRQNTRGTYELSDWTKRDEESMLDVSKDGTHFNFAG